MTFRNIGTRTSAPATVSGAAATRLFGGVSSASIHRLGVQITNHDATRSLWVKTAAAGATVTSLAANDHDFLVTPRSTLCVEAGGSLDVFVQNDSGGATPSEYSAAEVMP